MKKSELSTRAQLLLMLSLPVMALVVFAWVTGLDALHELRASRSSKAAVEVGVVSGELIHEQQKERGLSSGFLASNGQKFGSELAAQRSVTDQKLEHLRRVVQTLSGSPEAVGTLGKTSEAALAKAAELADFRRQVDALSVKPTESFARYTGAIVSGIDVISAVAKGASNSEIARETTASFLFVQAKEYAGRERATLNQAFSAKQFDPESFRRFFSIVSAQEQYLNAFRTFASDSARKTLDEIVKGNDVDEVIRMRKLAIESIPGEELDVSPAHWFSASTSRIDLMKTVESRLHSYIGDLIARQESSAWRTLVLSLVASASSIVFAILLGVLTIRRLMRRLGCEPYEAAIVARAVAGGDLTQTIQVAGGDTRSVMAAMHTMQEKLHAALKEVDDCGRNMEQSAFMVTAISNEIADTNRRQEGQSGEVNQAMQQVHQISSEVQALAIDASDRSGEVEKLALEGIENVCQNIGSMEATTRQVNRASAEIEELERFAQQIHGILSVIKEIAGQTNLLALNAAIESARAGEAGRGFAVVADEVRKLAERTTGSATEVNEIIASLSGKVRQVVSSMHEVVDTVGATQEQAQQAANAMQAIAATAVTTASVNRRISSVGKKQMEQIAVLRATLETLFVVVQENGNKVRTTAAIGQDLRDVTSRLNAIMAGFTFVGGLQIEAAQHEKRRAPRALNSLRVLVRQGESKCEAVAIDFSLIGMRLRVTKPLRTSESLDLALYLPSDDPVLYATQEPFQVRGTVVWQRADADVWHCGVEFQAMDDAVAAQIGECFRFYNKNADF
ncbi:nitrate- and nitrite sensing domain-containing protein [Accumulibacter sp.]|uniref:methyl-accepting chemotaxis protein n=1 Tax=Accumulibacter sp. TaxID=2053492 RepID=UPI001A5323C7|nr:nitrate- and nitrite sensing domain-containing protein [Accumulibacter sp.]MBL8373243.1 nitrate- and nitrite sensing domain-containing protein [Accumulibacter sp.]